jgi:hypothetical protein
LIVRKDTLPLYIEVDTSSSALQNKMSIYPRRKVSKRVQEQKRKNRKEKKSKETISA